MDAVTPPSIKERPIIFSAAMVRAILEGRKTQTRRIIKPQPSFNEREGLGSEGWGWDSPKRKMRHWPDADTFVSSLSTYCPYGQPGDRLWVRETWRDVNNAGAPGIAYNADGAVRDLMEESQFLCAYGSMNYEDTRIKAYDWVVWMGDVGCGEDGCGWRPSIHMPRWASRILLEVVSVRVERLQATPEQDAKAEGVTPREYNNPEYSANWVGSHYAAFATLWNEINGANAWDANPWVWVVEFKRVDA